MPVRNLVFQGGGVKGIAYAGALAALDEAGVLAGVTRVAGTSAGAIAAALVACGATAAEVADILTHTSFRSFADGHGWVIGGIERLCHGRFGVHPGRALETWLRARLGDLTARRLGAAQPEITLAEVRAQAARPGSGFRELFVVSTDLGGQRAHVLSADTVPDLPVWLAVRMSMSIPLFFEAVEHGGSWWADGAVSWNYPVDLFDGVHRQPVLADHLPDAARLPGANDETLGFSLGTRTEIAAARGGWGLPPVAVHGLESYMEALVGFILNESTMLHLDADDLARTVFIDTATVRTTQFDLTAEQAALLVANGRAATREFLARRASGAAVAAVAAAPSLGSAPTTPATTA